MADDRNGIVRREMFIVAEPDKMTRWMGVRTDLEPKAGGVYMVDVNNRNVAGERSRR